MTTFGKSRFPSSLITKDLALSGELYFVLGTKTINIRDTFFVNRKNVFVKIIFFFTKLSSHAGSTLAPV